MKELESLTSKIKSVKILQSMNGYQLLLWGAVILPTCITPSTMNLVDSSLWLVGQKADGGLSHKIYSWLHSLLHLLLPSQPQDHRNCREGKPTIIERPALTLAPKQCTKLTQ